MSTCGLVLSGGTTKVVYQIGALSVFEEAGISFDIVSGVSAGALVGAMYVGGTLSRMRDLVFEPTFRTLFKKRFLGVTRAVLNLTDSIYDSTPLRELIEREIPFDAIGKSSKILCVIARDELNDEVMIYKNAEIDVRALMATTALPGAFPPVRYGNHVLVDGGVTNNAPIGAIIDAGADEILCILVHPQRVAANYERLRALRSFWGIVSLSAGAELRDNMDGDIALAQAKNFCFEKKNVLIEVLRPALALLIDGFDTSLEKMRHTLRQGEDDARRFLDLHREWYNKKGKGV